MPEHSKSMPTVASELWQLVVAYFKQEAIEPIKVLGRFVGYGVLGSIFLAIGLIMLALAGLRALQTETTRLDNNLSWLPYLITLIGCGLVAAFAARAISRRSKGDA